MQGTRVALTVLALVAVGIPRAGFAAMTAEQRLEMLEEQLKAAQDEIRQLRQEVKEQKAKGAEAPAAAAPPAGPPQATAKAEAPSRAFDLPKWLDKISFFGDFRLRQEGFYNQPRGEDADVHARNRTRIRARVGTTFKYSDELSATVRLATGNPDDPISTNVTLDDSFDRKDINLDWAYVTVAPGETFGWRPGVFTFQGGKFALPEFRIGELVFDDDLSPEGFNEKVALLGKPFGYLQQVNVHAMQWTFQEQGNDEDGWVFGGQIAPRLTIGDVEVEVGLAQFWWLDPDLIAQQLNTNSAMFNTNLLVTQTVDGESEIVGYQSGFNQSELTAQAMFPDVVLGQPMRLSLDWVYNWQAATDQNYGVQGAIRFGLLRKRGDWGLTLLYEYLQQEAVIPSFTWSDFGFGGTNLQGPVVAVDYQLFEPLTLTARGYFTNYIERPTGTSNSTLVRTQIDAMVRW